ncbi:Uncharacterised protein [Vibrio cholerae]|nr:Uncharacterised protein [Vibrio cholerae]
MRMPLRRSSGNSVWIRCTRSPPRMAVVWAH